MDVDAQRYRLAVCIVVKRPGTSQVLSCHRVGHPEISGWQFPQGGIEADERVETAALRELFEEVGTRRVRILVVAPDPYHYDFPEGLTGNPKARYRGQSVRWALAEFLDRNPRIDLGSDGAEFDQWSWVSPTKALRQIVVFKRECYQCGLASLGLLAS